MNVRRIGIFQYEWPLQSYSVDLIIKLAESGYKVDFFYKESLRLVNIDKITKCPNVRLIIKKQNNILFKIRNKLLKALKKILNIDNNIIQRSILKKSRKLIKHYDYLCFIGIEKKGLIWAGKLSEEINVPLIYYSLELYVEDHPVGKKNIYLRAVEKKYHQIAKATIVQDEMRADVLLRFNEITETELIYIPVSVRGEIVRSKSDYFYKKFGINKRKKIILFFGVIGKTRYVPELAKIANSLGNEFIMVFHGFGDMDYIEKLKKMAKSDNLLFSLDLVPDDRIQEIISSAHVGIALYSNDTFNDRLTAFSSQKIALYLRAGVPIITFNNENYQKLMKCFYCGELINRIEELPISVRKIMDNYSFYKNNAYSAYDSFYNFDKNFFRLKNFIHNIEVNHIYQNLPKLVKENNPELFL